MIMTSLLTGGTGGRGDTSTNVTFQQTDVWVSDQRWQPADRLGFGPRRPVTLKHQQTLEFSGPASTLSSDLLQYSKQDLISVLFIHFTHRKFRNHCWLLIFIYNSVNIKKGGWEFWNDSFLFGNENVSLVSLHCIVTNPSCWFVQAVAFLPSHLFSECLLATHLMTPVFVSAQRSRGPFVPRNQANLWMWHRNLLKGTKSRNWISESVFWICSYPPWRSHAWNTTTTLHPEG